jgi:GNAT superfamily N-acetyltransferase
VDVIAVTDRGVREGAQAVLATRVLALRAMKQDVCVRCLVPGDAPVCDGIIRSLPYHFGDPQGREKCAAAVRSEQGLVAVEDQVVAGFLTWKAWFGTSCEITWMAVHAERRGKGVGSLLMEHLGGVATQAGLGFLLVTTLSPKILEPGIDDSYARTRAFYQQHGFVPAWEPDGWWNERNQALLMLRPLEPRRQPG